MSARPEGIKTLAGFGAALHGYGVELALDERSGLRVVRCKAVGSLADEDGVSADWSPMDGCEEARLKVRLADHGDATDEGELPVFSLQRWRELVDALLARNKVDLFQEWLAKRPEWDGVGRLSSLLGDLFGAEGPLAEWAGRAIFVQAAARASNPGCKIDCSPVLVGAQGIGKSALVRSAMPAGRQGTWYTDCADLRSDQKVWIEATAGRVLVELAELGGIAERHLGRVKQRLTGQNDAGRAAYARQAEQRPRRFTLVGTTNDVHCIPNDPSGFRRLVPVECPGRDGRSLVGCVEDWMDAAAGARGSVRDQLWAEARADVENGGDGGLPPAFAEMSKQSAEDHRDADAGLEDRMRSVCIELAESARAQPCLGEGLEGLILVAGRDRLPRQLAGLPNGAVVAAFGVLSARSKVETFVADGGEVTRAALSHAAIQRVRRALLAVGARKVGRRLKHLRGWHVFYRIA